MKDKIMKTMLVSAMLLTGVHFHQIVSACNQALVLLQATNNELQKLPTSVL